MQIKSILLFSCLASFSSAQAAPVAPANQAKGGSSAAVITVGSNKIKKSQIDTLVELMIKAQKAPRELDPRERASVEKMVATNLIGQELLDLEAKRLNVKAEEKDIDSMYRVLKQNFPDEATFQGALRAAGDSQKSLREKLARQIKADKLLNGLMPPMEQPTAKEIQAYYEKNKSQFPMNDSLRACQMLLLAGKDQKPGEDDRKKARLEKIRKDMAADSGNTYVLLKKFVLMARDVSEGPEANDGGDLGRFRPDDFNPEFKKQVSKLRVGQLSPVFKTPLGWHLLLLTERFDGKADSYKLMIPRLLAGEKAAAAGKNLKKYLQTLAARYHVVFLDKAYQDASENGVY